MNPHKHLIGVIVNGDARAYPIRIIVWHEMVNDTIGRVPAPIAILLAGFGTDAATQAGDQTNQVFDSLP